MGNCCESRDPPQKYESSCCSDRSEFKDPILTMRFGSEESDMPPEQKLIKLYPVPVSSNNNSALRLTNEDATSIINEMDEAFEHSFFNSFSFKKEPNRLPTKCRKISELPDSFIKQHTASRIISNYVSKINENDIKLISSLPAFQFEDGTIYRGHWISNMKDGFGEQYWLDGMYYVGSWKANNRDGNGRLILPDGTIYEGNWNDGILNYGYIVKGKEIYEGYLFNGRKNGQGIMYWGDEKMYQGEWKNGLMNGKGTFRWKNGRVYVGEYKNGRKLGYGEFKWPNGKEYKGMWNGSTGVGVCIYPNGTQSRCEWEEGKIKKVLDKVQSK